MPYLAKTCIACGQKNNFAVKCEELKLHVVDSDDGCVYSVDTSESGTDKNQCMLTCMSRTKM